MNERVLIIAEAGVNHNGSLERALEMVDVAHAAGADIIKFQTFSADKLARKDAQLADYQRHGEDDSRTQWDLLKGLELSHPEFIALRDHAQKVGIAFLSTGFDLDELDFLIDELTIPLVKVASGDLTFAPMLVKAGSSGLPIILSTGMATLDEIDAALDFIAWGIAVNIAVVDGDAIPTSESRATVRAEASVMAALRDRVTILHCTTQYPAELGILNLRAIPAIAERFGLAVGYSDHSAGFVASVAAVAVGATVIEKHFTLDKNLDGPDHAASLSPDELRALIRDIRDTSEALGAPVKECQPVEVSNKAVVRRSLVATRHIATGAIITEDDIECRRPGSGRTSFDFYDVIGTTTAHDYHEGDYLD
jgi:N-acetylneuraminate synthase